jgi:transporter family protein
MGGEMDWLSFALMGTLFFSIAGVLDKFMLNSYAGSSKGLIVCQALAQQLFTIPIILIIGVNFIYPQSIWALIAGSFQILPTLFYFKAMQVEEVSKVAALEYVYPVFVLIGSVFFLGENFELRSCAGGLLLLAGSILISTKRKDSMSSGALSSLSPAIKPFMFYWIFTAIYFISMKYLLITFDEWHLYTWSSLGSLMGVIPLISIQSTRHEVVGYFEKGNLAIGALISAESLQFLGIIFSIFAYGIGSISLVTSIGALQPIITIFLIIAAGFFMPGLMDVLKENMGRSALMQKALSFAVVIMGLYFIY